MQCFVNKAAAQSHKLAVVEQADNTCNSHVVWQKSGTKVHGKIVILQEVIPFQCSVGKPVATCQKTAQSTETFQCKLVIDRQILCCK